MDTLERMGYIEIEVPCLTRAMELQHKYGAAHNMLQQQHTSLSARAGKSREPPVEPWRSAVAPPRATRRFARCTPATVARRQQTSNAAYEVQRGLAGMYMYVWNVLGSGKRKKAQARSYHMGAARSGVQPD